MRPLTAMLKMFIPLLFAVVTWGAPLITHYEASYEVPYAGVGPQFAAWSVFFDLPTSVPNESSEPITIIGMTGSPWPDATLAGINIYNAGESFNDHMLRVWFDSATIGRFTYTSRGPGLFDHVGSYGISGYVNGNSTEEYFDATLIIHTPEPSTFLITASALASALILRRRRTAHHRNAHGCSSQWPSLVP